MFAPVGAILISDIDLLALDGRLGSLKTTLSDYIREKAAMKSLNHKRLSHRPLLILLPSCPTAFRSVPDLNPTTSVLAGCSGGFLIFQLVWMILAIEIPFITSHYWIITNIQLNLLVTFRTFLDIVASACANSGLWIRPHQGRSTSSRFRVLASWLSFIACMLCTLFPRHSQSVFPFPRCELPTLIWASKINQHSKGNQMPLLFAFHVDMFRPKNRKE